MNNLLTYILLGISLSMDAFSISIVLGTFFNKKHSKLLIAFIGFFHFIMPILGALIGYKILNLFNINNDYILGIILLILSIQIFISLLKKEELDINVSLYTILMLAMSVSLDSFTLGIGLVFKNGNIIYSSIVFSICSMVFTAIGLIIGKYTNRILGLYSKLFGGVVLLIFGLCQLFL